MAFGPRIDRRIGYWQHDRLYQMEAVTKHHGDALHACRELGHCIERAASVNRYSLNDLVTQMVAVILSPEKEAARKIAIGMSFALHLERDEDVETAKRLCTILAQVGVPPFSRVFTSDAPSVYPVEFKDRLEALAQHVDKHTSTHVAELLLDLAKAVKTHVVSSTPSAVSNTAQRASESKSSHDQSKASPSGVTRPSKRHPRQSKASGQRANRG